MKMPESDDKELNRILRDVVDAIENSKSQIFDIYESACQALDERKSELADIKGKVAAVIERVDQLKVEVQKKKRELARVSQNFSTYSEKDIRQCYAAVENVQVELAVASEQEMELRQRRDRVVLQLRNIEGTVQKAKQLATQIGVVLGYLGSQLDEVLNQMETANEVKFIGAKIIKAQENERLRVSREIHDGPAQMMANLIYQASICERMIDIDAEAAKGDLQELRRQIRACLSEIRQIIFDLRPMSLDDLGLVAAVQQFLRKIKERNGIDVKFQIDGEEIPLDKYVEVSLFRIIQEALNNVCRHAATKKAMLVLRYNKDNIALLIVDKGSGFDVEAQQSFTEDGLPSEQFGLMGMKERASIIKAQLAVESKPEQGTKIRLLLPLDIATAE